MMLGAWPASWLGVEILSIRPLAGVRKNLLWCAVPRFSRRAPALILLRGRRSEDLNHDQRARLY